MRWKLRSVFQKCPFAKYQFVFSRCRSSPVFFIHFEISNGKLSHDGAGAVFLSSESAGVSVSAAGVEPFPSYRETVDSLILLASQKGKTLTTASHLKKGSP
jgi:hypothetical protein